MNSGKTRVKIPGLQGCSHLTAGGGRRFLEILKNLFPEKRFLSRRRQGTAGGLLEVPHAGLEEKLILFARHIFVEVLPLALGVAHFAEYPAVGAGDALNGAH